MTMSWTLPELPGFTALSQTYAPWPVWSGSVANPVRFVPLAKKAAVKLWHRARDFDRGTHQPGQHGGAVGHTALQVLHTLIFDFLNHRTGRLDPSYAAIAAKAGVCVRTVATALAPAARAGHPQLGASLRRELAGRAVRARAGEQRLWPAAGEPVAGLPAAPGGTSSALARYVGGNTVHALCARPGRAGGRSCGQGTGAGGQRPDAA